MSGLITGFVESFGQGWLQDKATDFAGEHFQPTKDPYFEQTPDGKQVRRRLPHYCSKQESKVWKKLQNQAWSHDKGICGSCCWRECIGWAPMLTIIPIIGPAIMYSIHGKLVDYAEQQYQLPPEVVMKMHGNIGIDLAISLVPVLGIVFTWMNACSTRNCAIVYNFVCQRALEKYNQQMATNANTGASPPTPLDKAKAGRGYETTRSLSRETQPQRQHGHLAGKDTLPKYEEINMESYPMQNYGQAPPRPVGPNAHERPPAQAAGPYKRPAAPVPATAPAQQPRAQRPYV